MTITARSCIEDTSQLARCSDEILMSLVSSSNPEETIFRKYDQAADKDIFIAALIATLILRHKQWQGCFSQE